LLFGFWLRHPASLIGLPDDDGMIIDKKTQVPQMEIAVSSENSESEDPMHLQKDRIAQKQADS
jgi:hypothetical protein